MFGLNRFAAAMAGVLPLSALLPSAPPPIDDDLELVLRVQCLPERKRELRPSERSVLRDDAEPRRCSDGFALSLTSQVLQAFPLNQIAATRPGERVAGTQVHGQGP